MKERLLGVMSEVGMMAENLKEAGEWAGDGRVEEARLSMESVSAGAEAAHEALRAIALKSEELCATGKAAAR